MYFKTENKMDALTGESSDGSDLPREQFHSRNPEVEEKEVDGKAPPGRFLPCRVSSPVRQTSENVARWQNVLPCTQSTRQEIANKGRLKRKTRVQTFLQSYRW